MTEPTRDQIEAAIKRATIMMWGSVVAACIILAVLLYLGFIPPKYRLILVIGFVAATIWNFYWARVLIGRLRADLDKPLNK